MPRSSRARLREYFSPLWFFCPEVLIMGMATRRLMRVSACTRTRMHFFVAALLYNMRGWHFLKAPIIRVRRLLASGQSIISQLSTRASMPHKHLQRDLSITQIYDLPSSHSFRLPRSRRGPPRPSCAILRTSIPGAFSRRAHNAH